MVEILVKLTLSKGQHANLVAHALEKNVTLGQLVSKIISGMGKIRTTDLRRWKPQIVLEEEEYDDDEFVGC